jgi:hypothetical protein
MDTTGDAGATGVVDVVTVDELAAEVDELAGGAAVCCPG